MAYLAIKWLHILSATLMFGTALDSRWIVWSVAL
jgi:uncharacterized membrane protein